LDPAIGDDGILSAAHASGVSRMLGAYWASKVIKTTLFILENMRNVSNTLLAVLIAGLLSPVCARRY